MTKDDPRTFFLDHIRTFVDQPSISGVLYHCRSLTSELLAINEVEYPLQAQIIRDVFLSVIEHVTSELIAMRDHSDLLKVSGFGGAHRIRKLAMLTQRLNSYITFLLNSLPREAPPAVQVAITELASSSLNGEPRPVCLVIPQWDYNLECKPIMNWLADDVKRDDVDPHNRLGSATSWDLLRKLWLAREAREGRSRPFPERLAILSFARLDKYDTLMYPLLAHELGHFIDYKEQQPLHQRAPLDEHLIPLEELDALAKRHNVDIDLASTLELLNKRIQICIRELLADILAVRILGFPFLVAQAEFLKYLSGWDKIVVGDNGYPGVSFRLGVALHHLLRPSFSGNPRSFFSRSINNIAEGAEPSADGLIAYQLTAFLDTWLARLPDPAHVKPNDSGEFEQRVQALAVRAVLRSLPLIERVASDEIPDSRAAKLTPIFFRRIARLLADLPPTANSADGNDFAEILAAGWAYQLVHGEEREIQLAAEELSRSKPDDQPTTDDQLREYNKVNRLILKAIELLKAPPTQLPTQYATTSKSTYRPGVLVDAEIARRLQLEASHVERLDITPLGSDAVQAASIDLRLGNWFLMARRSRLTKVAIRHRTDRFMLATIGMEEIFVPIDQTVLVHPGDFMLGVTLEFVALPADLSGFVEGRSSIGRTGLIVATAAPVAPSFHGVLVLELANTGTVPIELGPGDPIAQLVLQNTSAPIMDMSRYRGDYYCQIKPLL